jgi:hypothetical protein
VLKSMVAPCHHSCRQLQPGPLRIPSLVYSLCYITTNYYSDGPTTLAKRCCAHYSSSPHSDGLWLLYPGATLYAWDQNYYIARATALLNKHLSLKEAAAPYLHLSSVLKGLSDLLTGLMGLQLMPERLEPQEVWGPGGG